MTKKRKAAGLIPYCIDKGELCVYLQKRDASMPVLAGQFGFFGGALEGSETHEQAMLREIKEELCYTPTRYDYLGCYEGERVALYVYYESVSVDFDKEVNVMEGEYGTFMTLTEALASDLLARTFKDSLQDLQGIVRV